MVSNSTDGNGQLDQETLELRHDVEELAERCRRMYEEANELVVRLRRLRSLTLTPHRAVTDTRGTARAAAHRAAATRHRCPTCGAIHT